MYYSRQTFSRQAVSRFETGSDNLATQISPKFKNNSVNSVIFASHGYQFRLVLFDGSNSDHRFLLYFDNGEKVFKEMSKLTMSDGRCSLHVKVQLYRRSGQLANNLVERSWTFEKEFPQSRAEDFSNFNWSVRDSSSTGQCSTRGVEESAFKKLKTLLSRKPIHEKDWLETEEAELVLVAQDSLPQNKLCKDGSSQKDILWRTAGKGFGLWYNGAYCFTRQTLEEIFKGTLSSYFQSNSHFCIGPIVRYHHTDDIRNAIGLSISMLESKVFFVELCVVAN
jgi:hypothetical protein